MKMTVLLFDGFTAFDVVGGYESLARLPGVETEFVAERVGTIAADTRALGLLAYRSLDEVEATDILYVPGGPGAKIAKRNSAVLDFVTRLHARSTWTVGICNGVEILASAGLLQGVEVTTNYFSRDVVAGDGAIIKKARYHRDGKIITGAGVSASADAGLFLTQIIGGDQIAHAIQAGLEYYPESPFGPRSIDDADPAALAIIGHFEAAAEAMLAQRKPNFP